MYKIVRYYKDGRKKRVIRTGVSLLVARLHCNSPKTAKAGVYFDGYSKVS